MRRLHSQQPTEEECPVDPPEPDDSYTENCDYCLQTADNNRKGEREELLVCKDCSAKGMIIYNVLITGVFST